jgi:hypothetical protein
MTLQPFEHYETIGSEDAYRRWNPRMKWIVAAFAIIGGVVGHFAGVAIGYPVLGVFAGGAVGYGIFRWFVYDAASDTADDLYTFDWCQARGMQNVKDGYYPANAPYAHSGDKRKATDMFQGTWNGLETLFYNFTYTTVSRDSNGSTNETDYDFKIMRLTGPRLPVARLSLHARKAFDFKFLDGLEGKFTNSTPIRLESAAFNDKFDLAISQGVKYDNDQEIWIRRIFDPATIASLVDGSFTIPDVKYYDDAWWFVEKDHFKIRDLEQWVSKQAIAANAIAHLSRVEGL